MTSIPHSYLCFYFIKKERTCTQLVLSLEDYQISTQHDICETDVEPQRQSLFSRFLLPSRDPIKVTKAI